MFFEQCGWVKFLKQEEKKALQMLGVFRLHTSTKLFKQSFSEFSMQFKKSLTFFVCLFLLPHCHASFAHSWSVRKELQLLSRLHLQASVTRFVTQTFQTFALN